ncbi:MAG: hypothetical protein JNK05_03660 [Myxococcales bacterium]|nr:hypothetical protein [Myxococcales bacterium]
MNDRSVSAVRRSFRRATMVLCVACACALSETAGAQGALGSAGSSRIEASVRVSQARAAIRRGDELEAVRLLRESIRLNATPEALRDLATILERRNERRAAAETWTRLAGLGRSASERTQAAERAELLRRTPSMLRVWVLPTDASRRARVWFDRDVPRNVPVGGAEAVVEGGPHRVRVESPGYEPFEVMVGTAYGEAREVVARMQRVGERADGGAAVDASGDR